MNRIFMNKNKSETKIYSLFETYDFVPVHTRWQLHCVAWGCALGHWWKTQTTSSTWQDFGKSSFIDWFLGLKQYYDFGFCGWWAPRYCLGAQVLNILAAYIVSIWSED